MTQVYNIGTRDSLLALTQSGQIKHQLEQKTGKQFRLISLKTQGDLNTSVPLWQMEGENFFTKELDHALINGEVDFVIHSYKDLGSKRPEQITLGAITKRSYAQDILLIKKELAAKIADQNKITVGTSSPRRVVNIEDSLSELVPGCPNITCKSIRGNVNTRIQKLLGGEYDAIVLALAGLERLANEDNSFHILQKLLADLTFMVLPQSLFPSAASQGALAVECLSKRKDIIELLSSVHDEDTAQDISREREAFNDYGGGCHLAVGIHVHKIDDFFLHTHKGFQNQKINQVYFEGRTLPNRKFDKIFIGLNDPLVEKKAILENETNNSAHKIVTSKYCIPWLQKNYKGEYLWAAGTSTMKKLASQNFWVNGSMDSLGETELKQLLDSKVIALLVENNTSITALSHSQAQSIFGQPLICYHRQYNEKAKAQKADIYYWTSFRQYQDHKQILGNIIDQSVHCCGPGKTYAAFKNENIEILPFANIEEFKKWIEENNEQ